MPSVINYTTFVALWLQVLHSSRVTATVFINAAERSAMDWTFPCHDRNHSRCYKLLGAWVLCHISWYNISSFITANTINNNEICIVMLGHEFRDAAAAFWFK